MKNFLGCGNSTWRGAK